MLDKTLPRLVLLGALVAAPALGEEFTLRFQPAVGATFEVRTEAEQRTSMSMGAGEARRLVSEMRWETSQTVLEPAVSGVYRIEYGIKRMTMSMRHGDTEMMRLDTDDEEHADEQLSAFDGMVGQAYVVEIDDLGAVVGSEGLDEMRAAAAAKVGDPAVQAILEQSFSENSMLQNLEMSLPVFPKEAVGIGDSWSREMEMTIPTFGVLQVDATYGVEGVSESNGEPCVRLGVEMAMEFDLNSPMLEQLTSSFGAAADIQMQADDVEASGWMCIARSDGVTLESEITNQLSMSIAIAMPDQPAMEMQMMIDLVTRQTATR